MRLRPLAALSFFGIVDENVFAKYSDVFVGEHDVSFLLHLELIFEFVATIKNATGVVFDDRVIQLQSLHDLLSTSKHSKLSLYCNRIGADQIFFTRQFFFYVNKLLQIVQSFFGLNVIRTDTPLEKWR
jgi:hypothetical protein